MFAKQEGGGKVARGAAVGGSCAKSGSHSQHRDPSEALNWDVTILMWVFSLRLQKKKKKKSCRDRELGLWTQISFGASGWEMNTFKTAKWFFFISSLHVDWFFFLLFAPSPQHSLSHSTDFCHYSSAEGVRLFLEHRARMNTVFAFPLLWSRQIKVSVCAEW